MLNSFTCLLYYSHKVRLDVLITSQWLINGDISLLLNFSCFLTSVYIIYYTRTLWYVLLRQGHHYTLFYGNKSPNTLFRIVRHPELIALYASAPNHVFGQ